MPLLHGDNAPRSELIDRIGAELSGDRMLQWARELTRFYRSPGASGYHRATDFVAERFRGGDLDRVWTERFPLDGKSQLLNQTLPLAWEPVSAELRIGLPSGDLLVSYEDAPSCLPWWTPSTPEGGATLELVDVGTGEREEDYGRQDVRGKAVLIRGTTRPTGFAHAATLAMNHGAAGIITDYLLYPTAPFRTRESLPEQVQLLRMPSIDNSAWAIAVDYKAAQRLASLAPCKVWADIQARTFEGEAQNLFADIEGTDRSDEYIMFVCHSTAGTKPGANCASGPALLIEMGQVISDLISSGAIPRPRRTIRFLVDVEGHGSKHYIQNHRAELENTVAAIAVDSVGHDQQKCKSSLIYYHSPDSLPSFINDYYVGLMEATPKETRWVFHTENSIPLVNFIDLPYTPWSDNKYYPVFGVPSPLLMSWPDLYFHTQLLTADMLDPAVFRRCAMTTTLAAIELANAGPAETQTMMREVATRSQFRLGQIALNASGEDGQARRRLRHIAQRDQQAVESALRLVRPDELSQHPEIEATKTRLQADIADRLDEVTDWLDADDAEPIEYEAGIVVPNRLVERDPPGLAGSDYWDLHQMSEEMRATDPKMNYDSLRIIGDEIWNFADGHRSVNHIAEAIGAEFDFDLEPRHVLLLFQGLANLGYVALGEPTG
jgi:hypothetical protein